MVSMSVFKPGATLTFRSVVSVRVRLCQVLEQEDQEVFCLDLSEVLQCDSAGLALIIEAKKLCKRYNKRFKVIGISTETQSLAEFCGVNSILETV